jgi:hypothetical protein
MRNHSIDSAVALGALALFSFVPIATGQTSQQSTQSRRQSAANVQSATKNAGYDPHDFSGIWTMQEKTGFTLTPNYQSPPMTPWAQAQWAAAKPGIGPRSQPLGNDPMMRCNPMGYPRIMFNGAYPFEFLQASDRLLEFFDYFYAYRTIWTDGRELPKDEDLDSRWYGYAVGKWDGDTFVVNSKGYDDRDWLDWDGHPHSTDMQLEERYKRVDHDTIEITFTVTDPKAYTRPWVSETKTLKWAPKEVMREDICAPADEDEFYQGIRDPAGNVKSK